VVIVPDDKDWTWVLERPCSECGFDAAVELVRANAGAWARLLVTAPAGELRHRPRDDRWSALEYACHVRDVCALFRYRLGLMLDEDDPLFPGPGRHRRRGGVRRSGSGGRGDPAG
jgi:hypothetical protein